MSLFEGVKSTEVGDARGLGLDLVGDAQEGPYLRHERLRQLLAVELQRLRHGAGTGARFRGGARAVGRRHRRRRERRRGRGRPPLRRRRRHVAQRPAGRADLHDLQLHRARRPSCVRGRRRTRCATTIARLLSIALRFHFRLRLRLRR